MSFGSQKFLSIRRYHLLLLSVSVLLGLYLENGLLCKWAQIYFPHSLFLWFNMVGFMMWAFCFFIWSWVFFLRFLKNFAEIYMGIVLNQLIAFGKIFIFTILISTYQRAWEIFPFSGLSFSFFLPKCKVLVIQVFHFFRVIPQCYILFVAILNGDVLWYINCSHIPISRKYFL